MASLLIRVHAAEKPVLTIEGYVRLALRQGDRVRTAYNNFKNATNSYRIAYRASRLPAATVASTLSKEKTEVASAKTETETSLGTLTLAQPLYPTGAELSASASQSTSKAETADDVTRSDIKPSYSATLNQPLYLFVSNSAWQSWKRSRVSYEISEDTYKRELQSIRNEARQLYFDVLLKREQLQVEAEKLKASQQSHLITEALVKAGRYAGVELSRSEVRLQRDKRRMQNAETIFQQAINEALVFASINMSANYQFTSKLDYTPLKHSIERLLEYAYIHRPDYKAAERQLILSQLDVKDARESNNPNFALSGTMSKSNDESDIETESWTGSVNMAWAFFDSNQTKLSVLSALNSHENQEIEFDTLKRDIEKELRNAYLDVKRAEIQIEDIQKSREETRRAVAVVRTRYKNGLDRLVDLFNSENDLRDVELEYLNALVSANLAKDNLALQVGLPLEEIKP